MSVLPSSLDAGFLTGESLSTYADVVCDEDSHSSAIDTSLAEPVLGFFAFDAATATTASVSLLAALSPLAFAVRFRMVSTIADRGLSVVWWELLRSFTKTSVLLTTFI
jgi:hypothetical protein